MEYLKVEDILKIHKESVDRFGGSHGVRDIGLLESAVERPKSSYGGEELYVAVHEKAAALIESLIKNHVFIDGNKRVAVVAAARFLYLNGYKLDTSNKDLFEFTLKVIEERLEIKEIAEWFEKNSKKRG